MIFWSVMLVIVVCSVVTGVLGLGVGVALGRRRRRPVEPKAICEGCTHHNSFHKDDGPCGYVYYDTYYQKTHDCHCLRYTGPVPLPTYLPDRSIE